MKKIAPYLKLFRNFYFVVGVASLAWMLFFDQYSIPQQMKVRRRIKALEREMEFYQNEHDRLHAMSELRTNQQELERFAREQHWMKRPDEDLFIVVEK
jgi:cell division protein FtsB